MSIRTNIERIRKTIPQGVEYVVVSKYRSIDELQQVYDAGMRIFAESRPAELNAKAGALPGDIQWHFIGHLQTNKLKLVLPHCALIHSVDSERLLRAIEDFCAARDMRVNVLMEVHIASEDSKQGFSIAEAFDFFAARRDEAFPHVAFCGLMGMATNTPDREAVALEFESLHALFARIKACRGDLAAFRELSMGMSQDYDIAIEHGATMVRIGSASFE